MSSTIVLTMAGDDRPGIIESLSQVLAEHGGSWANSNISALAGQFAGILVATVPAANQAACIEALKIFDSETLTIKAHTTRPAESTEVVDEFVMEIVGNDDQGIVRDITGVLKAHQVSMHELETQVESASMNGGKLFRARARMIVPETTDVDQLQFDLEDLANELMVDFRSAV